nr:hypothetical protein [Candidatus Sigynarchaeota archaeon]
MLVSIVQGFIDDGGVLNFWRSTWRDMSSRRIHGLKAVVFVGFRDKRIFPLSKKKMESVHEFYYQNDRHPTFFPVLIKKKDFFA